MPGNEEGFVARCLLRAARSGTLATLAGATPAGATQPFASLVTPATAPDGSVLMLLSALSAHTRHLDAEPRCAVLVAGAPDGANPQTAPRLTVTGVAAREPDPAWRRYWVERHPYAAPYAAFTDFAVWRLEPQGGHFVGGFAQAHQLDAGALLPPREAVDAVAQAAPRILRHCNADHADALSALSGRPGAWRMLGVDTDGFDLAQGEAVVRIAFAAPVSDAAGVRAAMVQLVGAIAVSN